MTGETKRHKTYKNSKMADVNPTSNYIKCRWTKYSTKKSEIGGMKEIIMIGLYALYYRPTLYSKPNRTE